MSVYLTQSTVVITIMVFFLIQSLIIVIVSVEIMYSPVKKLVLFLTHNPKNSVANV